MAYKTLNQQISIKHVLNGKNRQDKGVDRLSEQKFELILMICAHGFGLCPFSEVILYRLLSLFRGTLAIHCPE